MWIDPLVEEVRKRRRELMAEFDYNPEKVLEGLKMERKKYLDRLTRPLRTRSGNQKVGSKWLQSNLNSRKKQNQIAINGN